MHQQNHTTTLPTPQAVVVDLRSSGAIPTVSGSPGCCPPPAGLGAHGQATHQLSVGILIISCITHVMFGMYEPSYVYGYSDGWLKGLAIIRFAVYLTTIVTSSVVVCAPGKSKSFYSTCALVYLILGAVGLITLVVWASDEDMPYYARESPAFLLYLAPSYSVRSSHFSAAQRLSRPPARGTQGGTPPELRRPR